MKYLEADKLGKFLGTGEKNSEGQDLNEFLDAYDPFMYQNPSVTVDTLVFTYIIEENRKKINKILMVKRANHPGIGWWALPGGFVEYRENLEDAARRELREETGIDDLGIVQLGCYGDYDRDPRTRIITAAYIAFVEEGRLSAVAADDAADAAWFEISDECIEAAAGFEKHLLRLSDADKTGDKSLEAEIVISWRPKEILDSRRYDLIKSDRIFADHGAIILEGYMYLKGLLQKEN